MWTPDIVKIRFVEAAGTERFLPTIRKPTGNGYWPQYVYDREDQEGWDQVAKDDHMEIWQGRGTAKADALTRYQECLAWTIEHIADPERRRLVWGFAFCRANKREFGEWCKKRGKKRSTAYNHLNRVWDHLASIFNNNHLLLREPSSFWVGHEGGLDVCIVHTLENCASSNAIQFTPSFRTESSRDLMITPQAVEDFSKHLTRTNSDRRRLQEREAKRREKLGAVAL